MVLMYVDQLKAALLRDFQTYNIFTGSAVTNLILKSNIILTSDGF